MKKTLYLFTGAFLITQSVTAEAMISISTTLGGSRGPNPIVYNEMAMAQQRHQQEQAIAREQENRTRREREAREGRDRAVESARVERERVEQERVQRVERERVELERVQRVERERVELFRVAENQNRQVQLTFELEGIKQLQRLHRAHHAEQKIRDTEDSEKLKKLKTEGAIRIAQRQAMYDAWCFPGETPICVAEGQSQRIDTLKVGDRVESYDSKSGKSECRRVEQIFQNTVDHLTVLSFGKRILRTTDNHPFYLPKTAQWVQARDLRVGDRLQTVSGEEVEIDKIGEEVGNVRVFNFGVKDTHTYYAHGVLVHNCNNIAKLEIKAVGSGVRGAGTSLVTTPVSVQAQPVSHGPSQQQLETLDPPLIPSYPEVVIAVPLGYGIVRCFPGDTPVCMQNHQVKFIRDIQVGDFVESCNLEKGLTSCECRRVQKISKTRADRLIVLSFQKKTLKATPNHPFYAVNQGRWIEAQDLRRGDELQSITGETVPIEEIGDEKGTVEVHNLKVEGNGNYYAFDVLVHNCAELVEGALLESGIPLVTSEKGFPLTKTLPPSRVNSTLEPPVLDSISEGVIEPVAPVRGSVSESASAPRMGRTSTENLESPQIKPDSKMAGESKMGEAGGGVFRKRVLLTKPIQILGLLSQEINHLPHCQKQIGLTILSLKDLVVKVNIPPTVRTVHGNNTVGLGKTMADLTDRILKKQLLMKLMAKNSLMELEYGKLNHMNFRDQINDQNKGTVTHISKPI